MKFISSFMCFFGKRKIFMDDNESTTIVDVQDDVRVKLVQASDISTNRIKKCFTLGDSHDTADVRDMINPPAMIRLNPERSMPMVALSGDRRMNYLDIRFFSGVFAFLIFKDEQEDQFLAIKRLDNYASNHSVLNLYARNGRFGDELKTAQAICGGEIILNKGCIECWNLKSGGYSQNSKFDEYQNPNIEESIASLWLPMQDKFRSIKKGDQPLKEKYTPKGSFRVVSTFFGFSADKTQEHVLDNNFSISN